MVDYLRNVPIAENVIPSFVDTFEESASYVCESINDSFFDLLDQAGFVDEDNHVVEEAVVNEISFVEIKESAIQFFKNAWETIKAFFANVLQWFKDAADNAKKDMAAKFRGQKFSQEIFDKCPDDKKLGVVPDYIISTVFDQYSIMKVSVGKFKSGQINSFDEFKMPFDITKESNIKEVVRNAMIKNKDQKLTKGQLDFNTAQGFFDAYLFQDKTKEAIQEAYTEIKNFINSAIASIKEDKESTSFKNSPEDNQAIREGNRELVKRIGVLKVCLNKFNQINGTVMGVFKERYKVAARVINIIYAGSKTAKSDKADSKETATESMSFLAEA